MGYNGWFSKFTEEVGPHEYPRWILSVVMIVGSMIAGGTSEGGGAVAFPVLTLVFGVAPSIARDVSFMIQGTGMTGASFTILNSNIQVEKRAIKYISIGGMVGQVIGLQWIMPYLPPAFSKMYFITIWGCFAFSLFLLNRNHGRKTLMEIKETSGLPSYVVLLICGFMGGIFSAMAGSGIDICSFATLTLLFRIDEKIATPTSVILMAANSLFGLYFRGFWQRDISPEAWSLILVTAPIVVIGAPCGSLLGSYLHRLTLASFIYIINVIQIIGAFVIVKPWSTEKTSDPLALMLSMLGIMIVSVAVFYLMARRGLRTLKELGEIDDEGDERGSIAQKIGSFFGRKNPSFIDYI